MYGVVKVYSPQLLQSISSLLLASVDKYYLAVSSFEDDGSSQSPDSTGNFYAWLLAE